MLECRGYGLGVCQAVVGENEVLTFVDKVENKAFTRMSNLILVCVRYVSEDWLVR